MSGGKHKPLVDMSEDELVALLRSQERDGHVTFFYNDVLAELNRKATLKLARRATAASIVGVIVAVVAVVISGISLLLR